jgi:SAM-dependent methyltransferase
MPSTLEEYQKMYEVEEQLWWYKALHTFVIKAIEKRFGQDKTTHILDAGCGTGGMLTALQTVGYQNLKGIDHSAVAVQLAQERGLDIMKGDVSLFDCPDMFDVIICNDVFCYINHQKSEETIQNFGRHLAPNGIIISNNNAFNIFWGTHDIAIASERRFVWRYFQKLLIQNQLNPIFNTYWSFFLSPLVLTIRLWQRLLHFLSPQPNYTSDVSLPNAWLNSLLSKLVIFEYNFLAFQPFGSSLFWVAQKAGDTGNIK